MQYARPEELPLSSVAQLLCMIAERLDVRSNMMILLISADSFFNCVRTSVRFLHESSTLISYGSRAERQPRLRGIWVPRCRRRSPSRWDPRSGSQTTHRFARLRNPRVQRLAGSQLRVPFLEGGVVFSGQLFLCVGTNRISRHAFTLQVFVPAAVVAAGGDIVTVRVEGEKKDRSVRVCCFF